MKVALQHRSYGCVSRPCQAGLPAAAGADQLRLTAPIVPQRAKPAPNDGATKRASSLAAVICGLGDSVDRHEECRTAGMTGGANNKFFSRIVVLGLMALAFAGCAAMLAQADRSLFSEKSYAPSTSLAGAD